MREAEKEYAQAVLEISQMEGSLDNTYSELKESIHALVGSGALVFLKNPGIDISTRREVLFSSLQKMDPDELVRLFLFYLLDKGSIGMLDKLQDSLDEVYDDYKNRIKLRVVSAKRLEDKQLSDIKKSLKRKLKRDVYIGEVEIDESVIGGVKVYVDNILHDASIEGRLYSMGKELLSKELGK